MVLLVLCLDLYFLGVRRFPPPGAAGAGAGEVSGPRFLDAVPANFNPRAYVPGWEAPEDLPLLDHRGVRGVAPGEGSRPGGRVSRLQLWEDIHFDVKH